VRKHLSLKWGQRLGDPECPYMRRWALLFGVGSIRLHHWYRSDDKRAPHDHPWGFVTVVLRGSYTDVSFPLVPWTWSRATGSPSPGVLWGERRDVLRAGSVRRRPAQHVHTADVAAGGCWTLVLTGPNRRVWGFWARRADGSARFRKSNKWFFEMGHHPCDQP
jgi:hypothetical protein